APEEARCAVQQLLLPVVDLVRMHSELTRQLGDRPVLSDRRQRHLRLEPRIMFLPCPLHVLLPRYPRVLGAGLHLSQLSHFRGPPQPLAWMLVTRSAKFQLKGFTRLVIWNHD